MDNSYPEATGWELGPRLSAGKAQIWPSTGAGHLGQSSLHDTSHLVLWLSLLKVAGHLLDVLGEGGDVDPLPRLRDGMSSQLEVPENSDYDLLLKARSEAVWFASSCSVSKVSEQKLAASTAQSRTTLYSTYTARQEEL